MKKFCYFFYIPMQTHEDIGVLLRATMSSCEYSETIIPVLIDVHTICVKCVFQHCLQSDGHIICPVCEKASKYYKISVNWHALNLSKKMNGNMKIMKYSMPMTLYKCLRYVRMNLETIDHIKATELIRKYVGESSYSHLLIELTSSI